MYANTDNLDPRDFKVAYKDLEEIDKWLLSKYNKLVKNVTEAMDEYDLNKAAKYLNGFVNEELSNWYIRRNRRRFWASELDNSKKAVYQTTYEVLIGLCKLAAPIVPFTTDEIYTDLTDEESVHLADYPKCDESLIDENIEKRMDLIRDIISLGRNAREEAKIKVRQPISEVILDGKNKETIADLVDLVKEELNVKNVEFADDLSKFMNFEVKPNFKVCGPILGKEIGAFSKELVNLTNDDIAKLENDEEVTLGNYKVTKDMVDIRISSKEGFNAAMENNNFIILNTTLTPELIEEGIARELISKVQQLRKNKDFDIVDRIDIYYSHNDELKKVLDKYEAFIKKETLCDNFVEKDDLTEDYNLNGVEVKVDVVRNK